MVATSTPLLVAAGSFTAGVALVFILRRVERIVARRADAAHPRPVTAGRTIGALQLARWASILAGCAIALVALLFAAGVDGRVLAVMAASAATAVGFALREPIADFIAAASFLVERVAKIGDEVVINEELSGRLTSFGLRSVTISTWEGDPVYITASSIRSFRNASVGSSRAVVDTDIPANVRYGRATAVLLAACSAETASSPDLFLSRPVEHGVTAQHLDRYVLRISVMVSPARHREAQGRLKSACVDAVAQLLHNTEMSTGQVLQLVTPTEAERLSG